MVEYPVTYPAKTKKELKSVADYEKRMYFPEGRTFKSYLRYSRQASIFKALKAFRSYEYVSSKKAGIPLFHTLRVLLSDRRRNRLCERAGLELTPGKIKPGIKIWHDQVVIYGSVGEDCIFHGQNVVGNKKSGSKEMPVLGDRVDVGAGAVIIGGVTIADDCVIGAGAVVTRSFPEPGTVIAGVPARTVEKRDND